MSDASADTYPRAIADKSEGVGRGWVVGGSNEPGRRDEQMRGTYELGRRDEQMRGTYEGINKGLTRVSTRA